MTSPRSNVSAVVVRDRLYAVGGFSGKTFLNTIEYLDPETNEWTTFASQQEIDLTNIESLKDVVENAFHGSKSVSPIPPAVVEALQNGVKSAANEAKMTNGTHKEESKQQGDVEKEDGQVKVIKDNVLYSTSPGTKLGTKQAEVDAEEEQLNGHHPRVAEESEVNGSS